MEAAFSELWANLFESPVHLDSALSKRPPELKAALARVVSQVLLRPVSLARELGVRLAHGEPWSLNAKELASWQPALEIARRYGASPKAEAGGPEDFPPEMVNQWKQDWGDEAAARLARELSRAAPLTLRSARRVGPEKLRDELRASGIEVPMRTTRHSPLGLSLEEHAPVLRTEAFEQGQFEIQDEGSQLMALFALWPAEFAALLGREPASSVRLEVPRALPSHPPISVVDACAGAGGKSLALADLLKGRGRVFSYDISEVKLRALRRRASRDGLRNIQTLAVPEGNESESLAQFHGSADLVLVDAPCTGWGVLRRNPDIKWRQLKDALERLPVLQLRLLSAYSDLVRPGGRLVLGLCTFRKQESIEVVQAFLSKRPEFEAAEGGFFGPGASDGFFMQAFRRREGV
jgi:16S rRNA (cytosine967-C5)-methyltransferase